MFYADGRGGEEEEWKTIERSTKDTLILFLIVQRGHLNTIVIAWSPRKRPATSYHI